MKGQQVHRRSRRNFFLLLIIVISTPLMMGALCINSSSLAEISGGSGDSASSTSVAGTSGYNGFSQLHMLDENNGWALTPRAVLKTANGGKTWTDLTPTDWASMTSQGSATSIDSTTSSIQGIVGADFLDVNHAWIVAVMGDTQSEVNATATAASNLMGTVEAEQGTPSITATASPVTSTVYVRSTIDGGKTWMTSNAIDVQNLSGVSQPVFINEQEGWLELIESTNSINQNSNNTSISGSIDYTGVFYHTIDGGVQWTQQSSVQVNTNVNTSTTNGASPTQSYNLDGMNIIPMCENGTNVQSSGCTGSVDSTVQGCTGTPYTNYVGVATAEQTETTSLWLQGQEGSNLSWTDLSNGMGIPGGAPLQGNDSLIVASSPLVTQSGTGILPIQIESDPDGSNPNHYFMHLLSITETNGNSGDPQAQVSDLSPTTTFASSLNNEYNILSAPDTNHVFVLGQAYTNGTYGNWNLYEFNGTSWIEIPSQMDSTTSKAASGTPESVVDSTMDNLDFISDTEGWATDGSILYHITIANGTATWSQVADTSNASTVTLSSGSVIPAPSSSSPCNNGNNNNGGGNTTTANPGNMPMSVFNSLPTVQHTWYSAPNNDPPGYDSYPHAKGTGTYADPITFAIADDSKTFHQGEEIYIPELEKYFYAEDTCAACAQDIANGQPDHIDLWVGDLSSQCADNIQVPPTIYSSSTDPEPVHYLAVSLNDTADQNYTVNTQPFSCG
jgi:hypothetical protein